MTKEEIRNHFTDFRYLSSTKNPNILKEYVLYSEVLNLIEKYERVKRSQSNN